MAVNIPGYAQTDTPGVPLLPLTSALVAPAAGRTLTLEIGRVEATDLLLPGLLRLRRVRQAFNAMRKAMSSAVLLPQAQIPLVSQR
ncbi:MAG: hypothetical protein IPO15_09735 [Anaerolineae bacterium]|uniref:hypothetical protein n=1 Tax=Candidatus Amarolinea dominans TaxID=3140696 RepID=UPI0031365D9C|nr:hypothetical protein [Anaerolineae bacterium]